MSLHSGAPSGVDRVCLAYLKALCAAPEPVFGLVRTALGYVLLDDAGMQNMLLRLEGKEPWGPPDFLSKLMHKPDRYKHHTEAELRRLCIDRCRPSGVGRMLRKHVPDGVAYINVDQNSMSSRTISAVKSVLNGRFVPFLHDTIPLDFPEYQTRESADRFGQMLEGIQKHADLILCNSRATKDDIIRHMAPMGAVPPIQVAHLGVESNCFQNGDKQEALNLRDPYFVILGTIEPRKNHTLILDIWKALEAELPEQEMPHLVIFGRRGWMNEDVFARLDTTRLRGKYLHEFNDLNDDQIQSALRGSAGCLFPSFCEGFGLPPLEAASLGVPVICNTLPVLREFLADIPIYASVTDSYAWKQAILKLAQQAQARGETQPSEHAGFVPPDWQSHFNVVLKVT